MMRTRRAVVVAAVASALVVAPVAVFASHQFEDVPGDHTFHADIDWLADNDITRGCNPPANDRYCPDDPVTRGQMGAFMRRLADARVVDPIPYRAGGGLNLDGKTFSIESPLGLSGDSLPSFDPEESSVLTVRHTGDTEFPSAAHESTFGVYGESNAAYYGGAGVMGRDVGDGYGLLGEAGDVTGFPRPLGNVGAVGIGANRGIYGSSEQGVGVFAISEGNYGVYAQSDDWRGVTGRTSRADNNYGLYTPDNLFAANATLTSTMTVVVQNGSDTTLQHGDVVSFSGVSVGNADPGAVVAQVSPSQADSTTGVAGVVLSRFNLESVQVDDVEEPVTPTQVTPDGPIDPGDHMLLVVMGVAQVRVEGADQSLSPGGPVAVSTTAGSATVSATSSEIPSEAAVVGTALEEVPEGSSGLVWVFVGDG